MQIPVEQIINLLHECSFGTLATHSVHAPGYPFATLLPFVTDERHRPVFLMSNLAEHTKNIAANPHASLLVFDPREGHVLSSARLTMIGEVKPLKEIDGLAARYARYHPDAERYLALGDFNLFWLDPVTVRIISGFGTMGWMNAEALLSADSLPPAMEELTLREAAPAQGSGKRILGIDRYGVDVQIEQRRERFRFSSPPLEETRLTSAVRRILSDQ